MIVWQGVVICNFELCGTRIKVVQGLYYVSNLCDYECDYVTVKPHYHMKTTSNSIIQFDLVHIVGITATRDHARAIKGGVHPILAKMVL